MEGRLHDARHGRDGRRRRDGGRGRDRADRAGLRARPRHIFSSPQSHSRGGGNPYWLSVVMITVV
ncbi:MAG: hypothetical protein DI640_10805 [Sphingomonas taxi]|uniref:Uncharacterized protein n=1 Tax=Sphingomonas taxi TaxID=1549858 RepID=A0A2W5APE1_9SPHN|nr:MAG: hypothetical protein DI640_10805 [Sphingomonas taxi]